MSPWPSVDKSMKRSYLLLVIAVLLVGVKGYGQSKTELVQKTFPLGFEKVVTYPFPYVWAADDGYQKSLNHQEVLNSIYDSTHALHPKTGGINRDRLLGKGTSVQYLENGLRHGLLKSSIDSVETLCWQLPDMGNYKAYYGLRKIQTGKEAWETAQVGHLVLAHKEKTDVVKAINIFYSSDERDLHYYINKNGKVQLMDFYHHRGGETYFKKLATFQVLGDEIEMRPFVCTNFRLPFGYSAYNIPDYRDTQFVIPPLSYDEIKEQEADGQQKTPRVPEYLWEMENVAPLDIELEISKTTYLDNSYAQSLREKETILTNLGAIRYQLPNFGDYECYLSCSLSPAIGNLIFFDKKTGEAKVLNVNTHFNKDTKDYKMFRQYLYFDITEDYEIRLYTFTYTYKKDETSRGTRFTKKYQQIATVTVVGSEIVVNPK